MTTNRLGVDIWLNPLSFPQVDLPGSDEEPVDASAILRFLCEPSESSDPTDIAERYREISSREERLSYAPVDERILETLVWPLRSAKAAYMLGNYSATVALCGFVAEMVAVLLYEIAPSEVRCKAATEEDEVRLYGKRIARLGQYRRVQVLRACGIIDASAEELFNQVRETRNKYLHSWRYQKGELRGDAVRVFGAALRLVKRLLGQEVRNGGLVVNPALHVYLREKGVLREKDGE